MTGAVLSANTQLKLGHMFFLTHYNYACTVPVAASRCHSVPCATSLRIQYNVIYEWDPSLACNIQSLSWRTERQVIFSREYLPLECSLQFTNTQSTMFDRNYRFFGQLQLSSTNQLPVGVGNVVNAWFSLAAIIKFNCLSIVSLLPQRNNIWTVSFMKCHFLNGNE
jgi:hypothetical protein